jgi:lipopolysaccharide/colanic/teichoic acid biosynthesis glycosyltransferase
VFKRALDFILTVTCLIAGFPLFIFLFTILTFTNRRALFFQQTRAGFRGRLFKLLKFKTMNDRKDDIGRLLPDGERLTRLGRILRSLSLDELPQLINVLKGDMSLVGPRPLLPDYLPLYNVHQARRHEVKPGITGLAQINGRNSLSWEEKFELDVWYVDNVSFWLDLKILFKTAIKVLIREGINSKKNVTMERFRGGNSSLGI